MIDALEQRCARFRTPGAPCCIQEQGVHCLHAVLHRALDDVQGLHTQSSDTLLGRNKVRLVAVRIPADLSPSMGST